MEGLAVSGLLLAVGSLQLAVQGGLEWNG